jgi:hypothetical protein
MSVRRIILISVTAFLFIGAFCGQAKAQTQGFIDDANRAFVELKASREVIAAQKESLTAKDESIAAKNALIDALTSANTIKDAQIADLSKLKCSRTKFLFGVLSLTRCH